jgi:hypothetical protein
MCIKKKLIAADSDVSALSQTLQAVCCFEDLLDNSGVRWHFGPHLTIDIPCGDVPYASVSALDGWSVSLLSGQGTCLIDGQLKDSPAELHEAMTFVQQRKLRCTKNATIPIARALIEAVGNGALLDSQDWARMQNEVRGASADTLHALWMECQQEYDSTSAEFQRASLIDLLNVICLIGNHDQHTCQRVLDAWAQAQPAIGPQPDLDWISFLLHNPHLIAPVVGWIHGSVFANWIRKASLPLQLWTFHFNSHPLQPRPFAEFGYGIASRFLALAPPLDLPSGSSTGSPHEVAHQFCLSSDRLVAHGVDLTIFGPVLSVLGLRSVARASAADCLATVQDAGKFKKHLTQRRSDAMTQRKNSSQYRKAFR